MNSSVFNSPNFTSSSSSQFGPSDVFAEAKRGTGRLGTSCTEDKQTPSPGQCFLTHSTNAKATAADHAFTASPGDLAFAQKCADLQRFIRPLLELLHGLKSGRFDKGLTSFQQSVAIDRLQRILGILQKPDMGEKFLKNLLQIEVMLKTWFPQVNAKTDQTITTNLSQQWCQSQLHIPIKKRKMSWTDPDHSGAVSVRHKRLKQEKHAICDTMTSLDAVSTCRLERDKQNAHQERTNRRCEPSCAYGQFIGITSSCKEDKAMHCGMSPPSPVTQDNSVSSSMTTADSP